MVGSSALAQRINQRFSHLWESCPEMKPIFYWIMHKYFYRYRQSKKDGSIFGEMQLTIAREHLAKHVVKLPRTKFASTKAIIAILQNSEVSILSGYTGYSYTEKKAIEISVNFILNNEEIIDEWIEDHEKPLKEIENPVYLPTQSAFDYEEYTARVKERAQEAKKKRVYGLKDDGTPVMSPATIRYAHSLEREDYEQYISSAERIIRNFSSLYPDRDKLWISKNLSNIRAFCLNPIQNMRYARGSESAEGRTYQTAGEEKENSMILGLKRCVKSLIFSGCYTIDMITAHGNIAGKLYGLEQLNKALAKSEDLPTEIIRTTPELSGVPRKYAKAAITVSLYGRGEKNLRDVELAPLSETQKNALISHPIIRSIQEGIKAQSNKIGKIIKHVTAYNGTRIYLNGNPAKIMALQVQSYEQAIMNIVTTYAEKKRKFFTILSHEHDGIMIHIKERYAERSQSILRNIADVFKSASKQVLDTIIPVKITRLGT
jgi:hypothetical protein